MKKEIAAVGLFSLATSFLSTAYAQSDNPATGACAACGGSILILLIAFVVINIAILVWVVKDAKARGMGSPIGWLVLTLLFGPLALIVYFFSRPKGALTVCASCGNKHLEGMAKCPHCGN